MSILGLIKDVAMLPIDLVIDVTCIVPMVRSVETTDHEQPFGTIDRIKSIVKNVEDTLD